MRYAAKILLLRSQLLAAYEKTQGSYIFIKEMVCDHPYRLLSLKHARRPTVA